ncbi:hypothetical protein HAX54_035617, partial [Datura stramonium]|nr:hypothetical protein [Datura stramonium]
SSETQMKHRFGQKLASGHYLDPKSHWRFADCNYHLANEFLVKSPMCGCSSKHRRLTDGLRITFCGLLIFRWCCQIFHDDPFSYFSSNL